MEIQVKINAPEESKTVVERLVNENLEQKLKSYLKKFDKEDVIATFEFKVDKDKKGLFIGILNINIDGQSYRYEREDYKNLDDLVNNLFEHFKEELSKK